MTTFHFASDEAAQSNKMEVIKTYRTRLQVDRDSSACKWNLR